MRVSVRCLFGAILFVFSANFGQAQTCGDWYEVRKGDTLSLIAKQVYGRISDWDRLYQTNRDAIGNDPGRIEIGMRLFVACETAQIENAVMLKNLSLVPTDSWMIQPSARDVDALIAASATQIIDIRPQSALKDGVIPGAISMPFDSWRGPKDNPGHPASNAALSRLIGEAGLRLDLPIVIAHAEGSPFDTGRGAYVYWLLKSAGAERLALMDGGYSAWDRAGLPLADTPTRQPALKVEIVLADTWRATTEDVQDIVDGKTAGVLIDARAERVYARHDKSGAPLASTLPGARNISVPVSHSLMRDTGNDAISLLLRLKDQQVDWEQVPAINFCNTGEQAALNWFHASEVTGIKNVKLYPDSSHGWKAEGGTLAVADPKQ